LSPGQQLSVQTEENASLAEVEALQGVSSFLLAQTYSPMDIAIGHMSTVTVVDISSQSAQYVVNMG